MKLRIRWNNRPVAITFHWDRKTNQVARHLQYEDDGREINTIRRVPPILLWLSGMQTYAFDFSAIAQPVSIGSGTTIQKNGGALRRFSTRYGNRTRVMGRFVERNAQMAPRVRPNLVRYATAGAETDCPSDAKGQTSHQGERFVARNTDCFSVVDPGLSAESSVISWLWRKSTAAFIRVSCATCKTPSTASATHRVAAKSVRRFELIATTHSPYLLDLYRDHPDEVVLAQKEGLEVQFKQLSKIEHFSDILGDAR